MDAIRFFETVEGDTLTLKNLSRFDGEKVEVIVLPVSGDEFEHDPEWKKEIDARWKNYQNNPSAAKSSSEVFKEAAASLDK